MAGPAGAIGGRRDRSSLCLAPVPQALPVRGLAGLVAGYALGTWALSSHRYFSAGVRIQTDRE